MITALVVALLALTAFAYVALPLISPRHADPLPDDTDPVLAGLQEEKTALLRAIAELDVRTDLTAERRERLRQRYEAKAAATLKAIDARTAEIESRGRRAAGGAEGRPAQRRRVPVTAVALLGVAVTAAAFLPSYVLPRVGPDATITTTDVEAARLIRDLRRAADRDPTGPNLLALGDAYLAVGQVEDANAAYLRAAEAPDAPVAVFHRLADLASQTDLAAARSWLETAAAAAPDDPETLWRLSGVAYANGDMALAEEAIERYVALAGEPDEAAAARLELFARVGELRAAAEAEPNEANLLALADLYWRAGDLSRGAQTYLRLLSETGSQPPEALSRMGQVMLLSGATSDAAMLLERAATAGGGYETLEPSAQLALGWAHLQLGRPDEAVAVLEAYQATGGDDPMAAQLLASARAGGVAAGAVPGAGVAAGATGGDPASALAAGADTGDLGAVVFAASCAECHGPTGAGGMGVALAGNARAANAANVRDAVTFGRGMMPGFGATLSPEELDAVVEHVVTVVSQR